MKKHYLIDAATSLAVACSDDAPVLTETSAQCGDDLFLCYTKNTAFVVQADAVEGFAQNKFRVVGQSLILDPSWIEPVVVVPASIVPIAVTMRQARLALLQAGKLSAVNSAISSMQGEQGEAARIEWEFSSEVRRNQALVVQLEPVLGMTHEQIDQLFITAAGL